jgi:hypothetical protein
MISLRPKVMLEPVGDVRLEGEEGKHTNSSEFTANVQDHNHRHDERDNMHKRRGALENDRVGQLDIPREAIRLNPERAGRRRVRTYHHTQRHRRLHTYRVEVSETHLEYPRLITLLLSLFEWIFRGATEQSPV